ncbi:hypothetical protein SFRURICE_000885, partial [Spodoptera frugiperda]
VYNNTEQRMRAVILIMAVASAVAGLDLNSPDIAVPAVLEGAAPEDVLLYLYDVVLTSFMQNEPNDQGSIDVYNNIISVQKMRAVILVMVVASAVAGLDLNSPDIAVPAVLEGAAPEDVLLYLYDVVLTSFTLNEPNDQGVGPGMLKMRAVILVMAVASAVAGLDLNSPDIAVPAVLEGAAPEDVLLYLYDVVLTSFMQNEPNDQGSIGTGVTCPGRLQPLLSGKCPDPKDEPGSDYSDIYA